MNIYVKSRGVSKGYSWLNESQKEISDPPDLKEAVQIVDSDDFSIVLRRLGGRLSLLITGLESQNRTDNRTRKIRNSVLWVADESQEGELRAIAIQALGGELASKVDRTVSSANNDVGFQVDFGQLGFKTLVSEPLSQGQPANLTSKIGNLSELKDELIEELKQYSLPQKEGVLLLIVVSPTVTQDILERNKVWRGLSDTIDAQDDWIEIPGIESDNLSKLAEKAKNFLNTSPSQKDKGRSKQNRWVSLIAAFLLGFIVAKLGYFLLNQQQIIDNQQTIEEQKETIEKQEETLENQTKKINQLNVEIVKLNGDKNDLVKEIETKKLEVKAYQKFEEESYKSLDALKKNIEDLYNRFQNNWERSKKAFEDRLNALENKSNSSEDKAS